MEAQLELTKQKVDYSISHAQERALERYGLNLTQKDIFNIVSLIQSGENDKVVFMKRQSNYRTIWKINYRDQDLYAVYNNRHKVIATFLTEYMFNNPKNTLKEG